MKRGWITISLMLLALVLVAVGAQARETLTNDAVRLGPTPGIESSLLVALNSGDTIEDNSGGRFSRRFKRGKDKEKEPEKIPEKAPLGWFVGPMSWWLVLDMSVFDPMTDDRKVDAFTNQIVVGGLMGGVIRKDLRFGALVVSGYQENTALIRNQRRTAFINFDGLGVFADYDREIKTRLDLKYPARIPYIRQGWLVGAILGAGNLTLLAQGNDLGKSREWQVSDIIYFANPYAGLWISPYDWIWLQVDVGWLTLVMNADSSAYENDLGKKMVSGNIVGGPQFGVKIVFGENPNIKVNIKPPP